MEPTASAPTEEPTVVPIETATPTPTLTETPSPSATPTPTADATDDASAEPAGWVPWAIAALIAAIVVGVILFVRRRRTPADKTDGAAGPPQ